MGHEGYQTGGTYLCFGIVLMGLGTTFLCFSLSTADWISGEVYGKSLRFGLWDACLDESCSSIRADNRTVLRTLGTWIEICEVFGSVGFALWCLAIISTGVYLLSTHSLILRFSAYLLFIASMVYMVSLALFVVETRSRGLVRTDATPRVPLTFSAALYAGGCGVVCGTLAAALYLLDHYKHTHPTREGYTRIN